MNEYKNRRSSLPTKIQCLTWNIGLRHDKQHENPDHLFKRKVNLVSSFFLMKENLLSYDIICLQEVELKRGRQKTGITYHFPTIFNDYDHVTHETLDISMPHGNVILWRKERFTLKKVIKKIPLRDNDNTLTVKAIYVLLEEKETKKLLCIMNIHFKAGLDMFESRRVDELNKCLEIISTEQQSHLEGEEETEHYNNICICGDFNDNLSSENERTTGALHGILTNRSFQISPYDLNTCCVAKRYLWSFDKAISKGDCEMKECYLPLNQQTPFPNEQYPLDHLPLCFVLHVHC